MQVRDTKKIACLRQLLCSVQHELAMAGKSARQGASWLHQQQQRIDEDMAAMQAANSSLQAGIASLTANGRWRDSEMEDLESNVSNQVWHVAKLSNAASQMPAAICQVM